METKTAQMKDCKSLHEVEWKYQHIYSTLSRIEFAAQAVHSWMPHLL